MNPFKSIALSGALLAAASMSPLAFAQETGELEPIAEYVLPSELASADKSGFLAGITQATTENPNQAAEIVAAALQSRFEEIKTTPTLAGEIVMAVIQGLPDNFRTPSVIAEILDTAVGILRSLPADLTGIAGQVIEMVIASLPPDLAEAVKAEVLQGPQGALRDQITYIFTVLPQGGQGRVPENRGNDRGRGGENRGERGRPDRPPVTPINPPSEAD